MAGPAISHRPIEAHFRARQKVFELGCKVENIFEEGGGFLMAGPAISHQPTSLSRQKVFELGCRLKNILRWS